jgi:MYXO-CTERM domain-containing protein
MNAVSAAAVAWSSGANACSFLTLEVDHGTGAAPVPAFDGINTVTYQATTWCHLGANGTCAADVYDPATAAITSVYVSKATGVIMDADVEVNAKFFIWADDVAQPSRVALDLQNALTHELGHFIGLADSCNSNQIPAPLDDMGQPAPACDTASAAVQATTMFPSSLPGDTSKRTLAPDDVNGLCATYPRAVGPQTSDAAAPADADMCSSTTDGGSAPDAESQDATTQDAPAQEAPISDAPTHADAPEDRAYGAPGSSVDARNGASDAAPDSSPPGGAKPSGCGCALGGGTSGVGAAAFLAALAFASRRRREDRQGQPHRRHTTGPR